KTTSTPASAPSRHFMLTLHCSCHGKPKLGSSVIRGLGWLIGTRRSSTTLLASLKQMAPHRNVIGLTAHLLPSSGMVRFCPYPQVPLPSRLNSGIGSPVRPRIVVVLTLASAVWSAAKEASAPPAGAGATCLPPVS